MHDVGEGQRAMEAAAGLDRHADDGPALRVEAASLDQVVVNHGVEVAVVDDVVHVAVDVVVHPAGRDRA